MGMEVTDYVHTIAVHYRDDREFSTDDVLELHSKRCELGMKSWNGSDLDAPFKWSLAKDTKQLWFCSEVPHAANEYDKNYGLNDFVEGLWNMDVVELFIASSSEAKYQEFNFSPAGAWWSCMFTQYRKPGTSSILPKLNVIHTVRNASSWFVLAAIDMTDCDVTFDETSLVHITAICRDPLDTFYMSSCQKEIDFAPDFHNIKCFLPIAMIAI
jgi:hypothetical protein